MRIELMIELSSISWSGPSSGVSRMMKVFCSTLEEFWSMQFSRRSMAVLRSGSEGYVLIILFVLTL